MSRCMICTMFKKSVYDIFATYHNDVVGHLGENDLHKKCTDNNINLPNMNNYIHNFIASYPF